MSDEDTRRRRAEKLYGAIICETGRGGSVAQVALIEFALEQEEQRGRDAAVAAEREDCAKLVEEYRDTAWRKGQQLLNDGWDRDRAMGRAIRARGTK